MRRQTKERVLERGTADTRHHRYKLVSACILSRLCKQIVRISKNNLKDNYPDSGWEFVEIVDGPTAKRHITPTEFYRAEEEMSVSQLSEASGVPARQIYKLENGELKAGNMTAKYLIAIANALRVDPEWLLEE